MKCHNDTEKYQSVTSMFSIATFSQYLVKIEYPIIHRSNRASWSFIWCHEASYWYSIARNDISERHNVVIHLTLDQNLMEQHKTVGQTGHRCSALEWILKNPDVMQFIKIFIYR